MAKRDVKTRPIAKKWLKILRAIPGYDAVATAGDCTFDAKAAQLALDFFAECLQHVEGAVAGRPFALELWQQAIIANLFGWQRPDGTRRYRECLIFVPRKNGKTPLAAGILNYMLFCDGEAGAQCYGAAASIEQAALLYRHARGMVERDEALRQQATVYSANRSIVLKRDFASAYRVLSADGDTKHGQTPHFIIVDELHAQPNRELVDTLRSSFASANRRQPLLLYTTTAGFDRNSICYEIYAYACKVRDGLVTMPSFLPVIYEADKDADWKDEQVWAAANPNLGVSVSLEFLREECAKAQASAAHENVFRRLHLNQWTEQDVRWLAMDRWDACTTATPDTAAAWRAAAIARYRGRPCHAGLDLGATRDLTALAELYGRPDGGYDVIPYFWVPRETARIREQRDRVPYLQWIADGFVTATDGEVTDYDHVRRDILALHDTHPIATLSLDPLFQGMQLGIQLVGDGLLVEAFRQGFLSMAAPTKRFEELVLAGLLDHGANPVLRWMASNAVVRIDPAGNMKVDKAKSTARVDGIVTTIMALGRTMAGPAEVGSVYETRGLVSV